MTGLKDKTNVNYRGINIPDRQNILIEDQNINNFMQTSGGSFAAGDGQEFNASSRTIEQQTIMFSIHTGPANSELKKDSGIETCLIEVI